MRALGRRGARHPHDRLVLAAARADRAQLEPVQAVHAAIAAGHARRPQPRLAARGHAQAGAQPPIGGTIETVGAVLRRQRAPEAARSAGVLRPARACRRRNERPAGRRRPRRAQHRVLHAGERLDVLAAARASAGRGATRACRARCTAGRAGRGRTPAGVRGASVLRAT